ncbi:MAG: AAA family ATPase [Verrucomicrobia bacterium]|nr:AAA family ATPase [Verrucomicrobiota bacterium]
MIADVLVEQKREFERRGMDPYVKRDVPAGLRQDDDMIKVVVGPRRSGKSFLAEHTIRSLGGKCGYVNFDDERLADVANFDDVLVAVDELYDKPTHLLLDEIQNLSRWELVANRLQRQGRRLILTGSNSNLLSTELATHLTGRHREILLFPFSFREALRFPAQELTAAEEKGRLDHYARYGGFPEPMIKKLDYNEYLRTLVNSVLYKDIVKRFKIRSVHGLEDLAKYLFTNISKEFSCGNLAAVTQCKSVHTVQKYMRYMEQAFLFFAVPRFSFKVREQATSNRKLYCVDNGMATALGVRFSQDDGRLLENLVAIALHKRVLNHEIQLFYWRSPEHEEVDFVIKEGTTVSALVQVCFDPSAGKTHDREVRALLKAGAALNCSNLTILSRDTEADESVEWFGKKGTIHYVPLWKWLAGNQ